MDPKDIRGKQRYNNFIDALEQLTQAVLTSHTYNKKVATEIVQKILSDYYPNFLNLKQKMNLLL